MTIRLLYGFGINDADYVVQIRKTISGTGNNRKRKLVWVCPFYNRWAGMIERCYSVNRQKRIPCYIGASVHKDWKYFSNFKAWMEQQDWEGKELDKDILRIGNKQYGPDTCCFVSQHINALFTVNDARRGDYPIGVSLHTRNKTKPYEARLSSFNKRISLGYYETPQLAHKAWQLAKAGEINKIIGSYDLEDNVVAGLLLRVELLKQDASLNKITEYI